jgi:hypothetical protein
VPIGGVAEANDRFSEPRPTSWGRASDSAKAGRGMPPSFIPHWRHDASALFFCLTQTSGFALVQIIVAFAQVFDGRFRQIVFAHVDL